MDSSMHVAANVTKGPFPRPSPETAYIVLAVLLEAFTQFHDTIRFETTDEQKRRPEANTKLS